MPGLEVVITEEMFRTLRAHLLRKDGKERACFAYGGRGQGADVKGFYIRCLNVPEDSDYVRHSPTWVEMKPVWVFGALKRFRADEAPVIFQIHSHPFAETTGFSGWDDASYERNRDDCLQQKPEGVYIRMVWGRQENGFTAEVYDPETGKLINIPTIRVIGSSGIRKVEQMPFQGMWKAFASRKKIPDAFLRNVEWLGEAGQRRIGEVTLGCCGLGGIGNVFVTHAMHCGFRKFILVDNDRIEEVNFNRLIGAHRGVLDLEKAELLKTILERFDPEVDVEVVHGRIEDREAQRALIRADVLVNGFDNNHARLEAQVFAARHLKPMLDMGSRIFLTADRSAVAEMGAQMRFYIPGGPCLVCQGLPVRQLTSETQRAARQAAGYIDGMQPGDTPGSVITLNAVVAAFGLDNLIRYLTGFSEPQVTVVYDGLKHTSRELNFERNPACPVCGKDGVEGLGEEFLDNKKGSHTAHSHAMSEVPVPLFKNKAGEDEDQESGEYDQHEEALDTIRLMDFQGRRFDSYA